MGADPVAAGVAESWARPGGNVTGVTLTAPELESKRLDLLREVVPAARRIAVLSMHREVTEPGEAPMRAVAAKLGIQLVELYVGGPDEYRAAFAAMRSAGAEALVITPMPEFGEHAETLAALAVEAGLPTVCGFRRPAEQGCLIGYGPDFAELRRQAADDVARIFRGASPGELPIEEPTHFEFVVNLKTAKALGLTVPPSILARADEVIE
jgi:putative ABC transport system substrate-binding protein